MRVIFAGTPLFAAASLEGLIMAGHEIVLVLTQPDRPAGRQLRPTTSAVKLLALEHGLALLQPERLNSEDIDKSLSRTNCDVIVVAAYGLIFPRRLLTVPGYGCVNVHASLLPRWRGAAPIPRAILAGDTETGITIMKMEPGLDVGPVLLQHAIKITDHDTTLTLTANLALLGKESIVQALDCLPQRKLEETAQDSALATYAAKVNKSEAQIDWNESATQINRGIRAYNPNPGARSEIRGQTIKIWGGFVTENQGGPPGTILEASSDGICVACGQGAIQITELQKPGAKRMDAKYFNHGFLIAPGDRFGWRAPAGSF